MLKEKVIRLIGETKYITNENIIDEIIKNKEYFIASKDLNYEKLLIELKKIDMIDLNVSEKTEIIISFNIRNGEKKGLKIVKDVLSNIGSSYFVNSIKISDELLIYKVRVAEDFLIDPLILLAELKKFSTKIVDIIKTNQNQFEYSIDVKNGILGNSLNVKPNERTALEVPLEPYLLLLNNAKELILFSNKSNTWVPKISFYSADLNTLGTIEMNRVYEGIKISVPKDSKYVKIDDRYSLSNIKEGISVSILTKTISR